MTPTALNNWPAERRLPTDEEFAAAEARYAADRTAAIAVGDMSDFWCGLEFAMATYASWTWLKYFFPEESGTFWMPLLLSDVERDAANILRHLPREVTLFSKDKRPPKPPETKPDLSTLAGWKKAHEAHKSGPYFEAKIGEHEWWGCAGCGMKWPPQRKF